MAEIQLKDIASIVKGNLKGNGDPAIKYLETDSRRIRFSENSLFIAIRGERHDGHRYIADLYSRGLYSFLVDTKFEITRDFPLASFVVTENTVTALHAISAYYRKMVKSEVVAITGSNGKTMVKEWLFSCMSNELLVSRSPKSYNSQIGVPLSVWMINPEAEFALIEAGISKKGEMEKLRRIIEPDTGIITNIGQAHQENFSDLEEKIDEKLRLFTNCKTLFYCRDHELIHKKISTLPMLSSKKLVTWSRSKQDAFLLVDSVTKTGGASRIALRSAGSGFTLDIPFSDDASLENCLHIISFLLYKGFDRERVRHYLSGLVPVSMRLEQIRGIDNSTLINDSYNSDINSLRIALDFLAIQKQHKKHTLILSDLQQTGISAMDLYAEVFDILGSYAVNTLIVVGDEITKHPHLPVNAIRYSTTGELLSSLHTLNLRGNAILIKGARKFAFERVVTLLSEKKHTTVLEINLNSLVENLNYFRSLLKPDTGIMVMVKALSYGSGSFEIANVLQHEKVDYLGVAFADEGVLLREKGITLPVMVMSPGDESYDKLIEYGMEPEIFNFGGLRNFSLCVERYQYDSYPIHIKIDSGMHRLGFLPEETDKLITSLAELKNLHIKSIFSHLAASDDPAENAFTRKQQSVFLDVYEKLTACLGYRPMRHLLNSAGIERFPEAHFEMVRLGIGLHGISAANKKLLPASTLRTTITQIKYLAKGESVGYNRREILTRDSKIAIIPVGYADGLSRGLGNRNGQIIVNDRKVPIIGDVCMDMFMADITGMDAKEGDTVIVFGQANPVSELAASIGTIPYEVLSNISSRVKRVYINE